MTLAFCRICLDSASQACDDAERHARLGCQRYGRHRSYRLKLPLDGMLLECNGVGVIDDFRFRAVAPGTHLLVGRVETLQIRRH